MSNKLDLTRAQKTALRRAIADYMQSEGCSCCSDYEAHEKHNHVLGELLGIRPLKERGDIYYDFTKFRTKQ